MEDLTLTIPAMWADHHVLNVRETLAALEGVDSVNASALQRQVRITFDPGSTSLEAIARSLEVAGYPVGDFHDGNESPRNKPAWASNGLRVTVTNPVDLAMSGDYRKY